MNFTFVHNAIIGTILVYCGTGFGDPKTNPMSNPESVKKC
jgi:hypothetical protein